MYGTKTTKELTIVVAIFVLTLKVVKCSMSIFKCNMYNNKRSTVRVLILVFSYLLASIYKWKRECVQHFLTNTIIRFIGLGAAMSKNFPLQNLFIQIIYLHPDWNIHIWAYFNYINFACLSNLCYIELSKIHFVASSSDVGTSTKDENTLTIYAKKSFLLLTYLNIFLALHIVWDSEVGSCQHSEIAGLNNNTCFLRDEKVWFCLELSIYQYQVAVTIFMFSMNGCA